MGESAISCIIQEREQAGAFTGLFDFCHRLDLRKVNRRVLEALIKCGAMDVWQQERSVLFASLEKALKIADAAQQNQNSGQTDLFSLIEDSSTKEDYQQARPWNQMQRLDGEKETLGLYFSGHPAGQYVEELKSNVTPISKLNPSGAKKAWICALLTGLRRVITKRGKKLVILSVEDVSGKMDVVVFSEVFDTVTTEIQNGMMLVIEGEISRDDFNGGIKMSASQILTIAEARIRFAKSLKLNLSFRDSEFIGELKSILKNHKGHCVTQVLYQAEKASVMLSLGTQYCVSPSDELLNMLRELLGNDNVRMCY